MRIVGRDSTLFFGPTGALVVGDAPIAFSGVNFTASWKQVTPLIIRGKPINTLVENAKLDNVTQPIENVIWMNVDFVNSVVAYSGGPVFLENVRFKDCTFQFRPGPSAAELKDRITKADGGPITYAYSGSMESR